MPVKGDAPAPLGHQAFLFTTTPHTEDVNPKVIVPYANDEKDPMVHQAMRLNFQMQGIEPRMEKMYGTLDEEFAYDRLFRRLWAEAEPFVIVEHDILPWPGAIDGLLACREEWCGHQYYVHGQLRSYLGCVKFDPVKIGPIPLPDEPVLWSDLDLTIIRALSQRGHTGHLHGPAVVHLKYWHQRMTKAEIILPDWMI